MAHTPGPWHIEEDDHFPWDIRIVSQTGEVLVWRRHCHSSRDKTLDDVMKCRHHGGMRVEASLTNHTQMADARLIAAAPDLLVALEAIASSTDYGADDDRPLMRQARAAIAAAKEPLP